MIDRTPTEHAVDFSQTRSRTNREILEGLNVITQALMLTDDKMGELILTAASHHLAGRRHPDMPSTVGFWAMPDAGQLAYMGREAAEASFDTHDYAVPVEVAWDFIKQVMAGDPCCEDEGFEFPDLAPPDFRSAYAARVETLQKTQPTKTCIECGKPMASHQFSQCEACFGLICRRRGELG